MENTPSTPTEKNKYALLQFKRDEDGTQRFQEVTFYKLNPDGSYENGTTLEEMLRVCFKRTLDLDSRFHCEENITAAKHIEEALVWLNKRTEDRTGRGVEG